MAYLAAHDHLTGLVNRVEFESRLQRAIDSAKFNNRQHALCFIDLDRFKLVNDSSGHSAGDELLRQIALQLGTIRRESDTFGRLGGDEFGLLLEDCDLSIAVEFAERMRKTIDGFQFKWDGRVFDVGASVGVVAITAISGELKDVMHVVDTACYAAKAQGRNQVRISREPLKFDQGIQR
ncbi:MAG: diguanylate cyclase [Gammaproteobacteria bacterium]|nr:diguanylate cyclase [Gammaproteobacteria bacterium]